MNNDDDRPVIRQRRVGVHFVGGGYSEGPWEDVPDDEPCHVCGKPTLKHSLEQLTECVRRGDEKHALQAGRPVVTQRVLPDGTYTFEHNAHVLPPDTRCPNCHELFMDHSGKQLWECAGKGRDQRLRDMEGGKHGS